jgi:flagellar biosynthesis/type III secretory pathway protein FliH
MMLNILTSRFKLSTHEARMFALAGIAPAPPERREEYAHIILECSPEKIRPALEELMATHFKSPFIESFRNQGIEEGRAKGLAEGLTEGRVEEEADALFTVFIPILDQARSLISACTDPDQFKKWIARAATAKTLDEVFVA